MANSDAVKGNCWHTRQCIPLLKYSFATCCLLCVCCSWEDPGPVFEYDLMNEADFPSINIASGVEGDEVTEGIPDPYADQSPRIEVPELVYTQDPPYDPSVVEIGEKVIPV